MGDALKLLSTSKPPGHRYIEREPVAPVDDSSAGVRIRLEEVNGLLVDTLIAEPESRS